MIDNSHDVESFSIRELTAEVCASSQPEIIRISALGFMFSFLAALGFLVSFVDALRFFVPFLAMIKLRPSLFSRTVRTEMHNNNSNFETVCNTRWFVRQLTEYFRCAVSAVFCLFRFICTLR